MVELDAEKVLTIPRKIRSVEVVKRGFMSNFLFQNISNIFGAPKEVIDIITKFEPIEEPKSKVNLTEEVQKDLSLDENGEVALSDEFVIGRTQDVFGDKIYDVTSQVQETMTQMEQAPDKAQKAIDKLKEAVKQSAVKAVVDAAQSTYGSDMKAVDKRQIESKLNHEADRMIDNYGAPKITVELRKTGEVISERTVGTYMRQMGIRAQWSKPWTITTKDSDFSTELQNILDEQFNPDRPNAVWCSDITYIWTIDGFVYLTSVMDLFSRKIIAWTLSETLEVSCVIDTINKAKARRNIDQPLIIHSDRGSQYVAKEYKKATENMQHSYSKKAFPWDNACIESFHYIIKREWLNRFKIRDYKQAYQLIFEYLEAFYNTKRIHSHCNYMSPNEFERVYERTHTEAELLAG